MQHLRNRSHELLLLLEQARRLEWVDGNCGDNAAELFRYRNIFVDNTVKGIGNHAEWAGDEKDPRATGTSK